MYHKVLTSSHQHLMAEAPKHPFSHMLVLPCNSVESVRMQGHAPDTEMTTVCTMRSLLGASALAVVGTGLIAGKASAQSASGFYLNQEIGLNVASAVELFGNSNDRASRCDEFINPRFAEVPGCTDPNRGSGAGWKTTYDRAAGMLAGLSGGYRFGGRLRVEVEWFHRESEYDQTCPAGQQFAPFQRPSTALGPVANTDTKLLIYGLFLKGRVLAQDGVEFRVPGLLPIRLTSGGPDWSDGKLEDRLSMSVRGSRAG